MNFISVLSDLNMYFNLRQPSFYFQYRTECLEVNFSTLIYPLLFYPMFLIFLNLLLKKNRGLLFLHGRRSTYRFPFFSFLIPNTRYTCTVLYKYQYLYITDGSEIYFSFSTLLICIIHPPNSILCEESRKVG